MAHARGERIHVVHEEPPIRGRALREGEVQLLDEARVAARRGGIEISHRRERRVLEVVLDDGAVEILLDGFPHPLEALELAGDPRLQIVLGETRRGIARYVQEVRVQVDQVGFEIDQGPDVDGRILVEAVVIRLTELRPEAVGEEQELEQVCELVGGRAAENGHAQRAQRGVFQELPAQPLSLLQDLVDRARTELPERRGRTLVASWPMLPVQPIE